MKMEFGTTRVWYETDASASLGLIDSFVKGIEQQAHESILRYEKEREFRVEEFAEGEESYLVEIHQGLDSQTWPLETIFREYFPSLQRRSAFLTVWSYFEHELDKLCSLYKAEKGFRLASSDLNGRGIDRSISYLEKVAGLKLRESSQEWIRIKKMQNVRNVIVHQDGRLHNRENDQVKAVIEYMKETEHLSGHDEIELKEGFLSSVVETLGSYFRLINEAINANEENLRREPNQSK
jgi:hypothetical protein